MRASTRRRGRRRRPIASVDISRGLAICARTLDTRSAPCACSRRRHHQFSAIPQPVGRQHPHSNSIFRRRRCRRFAGSALYLRDLLRLPLGGRSSRERQANRGWRRRAARQRPRRRHPRATTTSRPGVITTAGMEAAVGAGARGKAIRRTPGPNREETILQPAAAGSAIPSARVQHFTDDDFSPPRETGDGTAYSGCSASAPLHQECGPSTSAIRLTRPASRTRAGTHRVTCSAGHHAN